jgi:hypothetical protein
MRKLFGRLSPALPIRKASRRPSGHGPSRSFCKKLRLGSEAERERSRLAGAADASFLRQGKKERNYNHCLTAKYFLAN